MEKLKSKNLFCFQSKTSPPNKRLPGDQSRYGKYEPVRIENFEKPYSLFIASIA
jgi:hypothetical protein